MQSRDFNKLADKRLEKRGSKILNELFRKQVHSIRQITENENSAKGFYRFLQNKRVSEDHIIENFVTNCKASITSKYLICIQDTTEINLSSHSNRINKDDFIGTTNAKNDKGLGFFIHPSLVLDASNSTPYGYADIKIWNRPLDFKSKKERNYNNLPIEEKESYKWIEVSKNTKKALGNLADGILIIQDREGDIYEQFAVIPDEKTDLLVRARTDRTLTDGTKLFSCLTDQQVQGYYEIIVDAKKNRPKRTAKIEVRYREIEITSPRNVSKELPSTIKLTLIEAKEVDNKGEGSICWRLLTTIKVENIEVALACIEWYSWRWLIEEIFKILKKEGYQIESSELEYASSVRKLTLLMMETIIKLFLMRLAYAEPEIDINANSCFSDEEQEFLELQIERLEGKTEKQKNPYKSKDLKRYVWAIARLGGWKGYEYKRHPGITTLWIGLRDFNVAMQGWLLARNVSAR